MPSGALRSHHHAIRAHRLGGVLDRLLADKLEGDPDPVLTFSAFPAQLESLEELRTLYTSEVVERLRGQGMCGERGDCADRDRRDDLL